MKTELVTLIMIKNNKNQVLVQDRKLKYPGISFPGGHVETGESIVKSAIREVKEETNLDVSELKLCGIVHWSNKKNSNKYICFMYKTDKYLGKLVNQNREGNHYWINLEELKLLPPERFSSLPEIYALSPLLHETNKYSEVFIEKMEEKIINIQYL